MDLNYKMDDLRDEAKQDTEAEVKAAIKRHVNGVDRMVELADDPEELIEHLDWLTGQTKGARVNLRSHQPVAALGSSSSNGSSAPAALGSGTSSSSDENVDKLKQLATVLHMDFDKFVEAVQTVFQPLESVNSGTQLKARAAAMQRIADGTIPVKNDGTLEVEQQLQSLQAEHRPFQTAAASLKSAPQSDRDKLIKGINRVTDGRTKVKNDGSPDVPTPQQPPAAPPAPTGISADDQARLDVLDKIVPALVSDRRNRNFMFPKSTLDKDDRNALGIPLGA